MAASDLPCFEAFAASVGDRFSIEADGAVLTAELVEAEPLGGVPGRPFTLLFRVADDRPLPQRIYPLEHDCLGRFELFLVPVGADRDGTRYEAVFN